MAGFARAQLVALECPDPRALAAFYSAMTGLPVISEDDDWVTLGPARGQPDSGLHLAFQQAPAHVAPRWPDPASSMQMHLDFTVDDLDRGEEEVLRLGATKFAHQPSTSFRVYADPAGHPFCLVTE